MMRLLIFSFLLFLSCKKNNIKASDNAEINSATVVSENEKRTSENNWEGNWIYVKKEKNADVPEEQLTITIIQEGNKMKAQYCAITNSGGKIDCESGNVYNMEGIVQDKKITGRFYSFFGSTKDKGDFELIMNNDASLTWKVKRPPNGIFYAPDECILRKEVISADEDIKSSEKTKNITNQENVFPINYENFDEKVKFEIPIDENIKSLFSQKFQLSVDAISELPSTENFNIYLINNVSGDSDLIYIVTIKGNKLLDGLEIGNGNADIRFTIDSKYNISIYSSKNGKNELIKIYYIDNNGNFIIK
jgi:hypothetical protein